MYMITLANGTTLENLDLNGNNFISTAILADSVFEGGLGSVVISDGTTAETYKDMVLISNRVDGGRSWFILAEKTEREKEYEQFRENLEALEDLVAGLLFGKV